MPFRCGQALIAAVMAAALVPSPASAAAPCPAAAVFPDGLRVVSAVRVVTGPGGESAFVPARLDAATHAYFKPGELFAAIDFKGAQRVQIVAGPPDVDLPYHASLAYEMFLTIQGSSTVILRDGQRRDIGPGMLVIMEDMGSKTGHAGRTGPCGYVALQIVPTAPIVP